MILIPKKAFLLYQYCHLKGASCPTILVLLGLSGWVNQDVPLRFFGNHY